MAQSGNILEKKWQKIVYEKHRRRLRETQSNLKQESKLQYSDEEAQLQMRFRRITAEEHRQAVIDKQNSKLLQRIVDIMTSKKKTFPVANSHEARRKVSKPGMVDSSTAKPKQSSVKLPALASPSDSGSKKS